VYAGRASARRPGPQRFTLSHSGGWEVTGERTMAEATDTQQDKPEGSKHPLARLVETFLDITEQQRAARSRNPLVTQIFDWVIDISAFAGALIVLYVALTIGANVLGRYVFESPLKWALPTTEYSLLYLTFLAAPIVLRREGHVRMTAITERLGNTAKLWFYIVGSFISSGVCGIMAWKSFEKTLEEFQSGSILLSGIEVHRALVTWVIPYGFILLGLQFLRMGINAVRLRRFRETVEEAGI